MAFGFGGALVQGAQGRARELELAAGLQTDIGRKAALRGALQADQGLAAVFAIFDDIGPAEPFQAGQQGMNARVPFIGNRGEVFFVIAELFVFGADAIVRARLAPLRQSADQIISGKRLLASFLVRHVLNPHPVGGSGARRSLSV